MDSVYVELERLARKHALEAIEYDRRGMYDYAIEKYRRAIDVLSKLIALDPRSPFAAIYTARMREYKKRLGELEGEMVKIDVSDSKVDASLEEVILKERPRVHWEDIADLEEAKIAIREAIVYPVKRPDLFPLGWPRGILLFGPPGCGKTLLAAAVATEIDAVFFRVDAASIMSKWLGEAEKNVARLFRKGREEAKKGKPAIIFIDEVDALFGTHVSEVGGEVRVRNQFLTEMDGLQDKNERIHLYVIGATNKPWRLDNAFIRRFQKRIYIPLPDFEARVDIFRIYTRNLNIDPDVSLEELARLTEGYAASDIRDICQAAQNKVVREYFELSGSSMGKPRPIKMEDFIDIIKKRRPSVNPRMLEYYERWAEEFKAL